MQLRILILYMHQASCLLRHFLLRYHLHHPLVLSLLLSLFNIRVSHTVMHYYLIVLQHRYLLLKLTNLLTDLVLIYLNYRIDLFQLKLQIINLLLQFT